MSRPDSKRPDPKKIARRPMARAGREIAFARRRADAPQAGPLFAEGPLDIDALHAAVEGAESVIEGRPYAGAGEVEVFFGSAVLRFSIDVPAEADRLLEALEFDTRGRRVLQDRVYRELARLLGPRTPDVFEMSHRAQVEGAAVRIDVDIEAPLPGTAKANGGR